MFICRKKYVMKTMLFCLCVCLFCFCFLLFYFFGNITLCGRASLVAQAVKNTPVMQKTWVRSLGRKDPLEKGMSTHSEFLAGEAHGQRSLDCYSP